MVGLFVRAWIVLVSLCALNQARAEAVEERRPAAQRSAAQDARFEGIEQLIEEAIARRELPGCVVSIGTHDGPLYTRAFGERTAGEPMSTDTLFDLASLTKPIVTAASVASLLERGKLRLDDHAADFLHEFRRPDKRAITVRQLLLHTSGLPAVSPLADFEHGRAEALAKIATLKLASAPGVTFEYSDLGYLVLGEIVAKAAAMPLERWAEEKLFAPLAMRDTRFHLAMRDRARAAPTELRDGQPIRGVVDDPRAYRLGGVAGHAGLFSSAIDVARFARMLLRAGELDGQRVLSRASVATMVAVQKSGKHLRTLGFDVRSPYDHGRGLLLSERAFGHGGYTGTSLWVDPEARVYVLFLSNRVHSGARGTIHPLVSSIADVALAALATRAADGVAVGSDVLSREAYARLRGRKVALLTHLAARDRQGKTTLEQIGSAPGLTLLSILTPEHGLSGKQEGRVSHRSHGRTPVYSLFGQTRRPTRAMLASVDTIVIDLVDVGARFYTYMATVLATMQVASELGLPVFLLDRPNPIDGVHVEGPISERAYASFVNYHPLPLRHGMTIGELARLLVRELHLELRLHVVRVEGWQRAAWSGTHRERWDAPSPNLGSPEQALLYPAVALVEGTNVSVGRGTSLAFRVVGAPFIDGEALAAALRAHDLPGVAIRATRFRPSIGPHRGLRIPGVELTIRDAGTFSAARTGLALLRALRECCADRWQSARIDRMVAHAATLSMLQAGVSLQQIEKSWAAELAQFAERRSRALLY